MTRLAATAAESAVPIGRNKMKQRRPRKVGAFFMSVPEPRGSRASLMRQEYARLS